MIAPALSRSSTAARSVRSGQRSPAAMTPTVPPAAVAAAATALAFRRQPAKITRCRLAAMPEMAEPLGERRTRRVPAGSGVSVAGDSENGYSAETCRRLTRGSRRAGRRKPRPRHGVRTGEGGGGRPCDGDVERRGEREGIDHDEDVGDRSQSPSAGRAPSNRTANPCWSIGIAVPDPEDIRDAMRPALLIPIALVFVARWVVSRFSLTRRDRQPPDDSGQTRRHCHHQSRCRHYSSSVKGYDPYGVCCWSWQARSEQLDHGITVACERCPD